MASSPGCHAPADFPPRLLPASARSSSSAPSVRPRPLPWGSFLRAPDAGLSSTSSRGFPAVELRFPVRASHLHSARLSSSLSSVRACER
uniref:Uncharacterized protein n=1 Tax=Zea mays TaxID=4577 RepID=C0P5H0_MAIZE|nr:unknown [Zea mays]